MGIREAILHEAVEALAEGGEASLRVHDIARKVGCSVSALYVHYGSREGLAEAALIERYRREASGGDHFVEQLHTAKSVSAVKKAISAHVQQLCSEAQAPVHLARAELLVAARTRPSAREALTESEQVRQRALVEALRAVRERGLVRRDVDPEATATLLRSWSLSQALVYTEGTSAETRWARVLHRTLESLLLE